MKLTSTLHDSFVLLKIEGSLSSESKHEFEKYINQLIPQKKLHLILDLSTVSFIDSIALGAILKFYSLFKKNKHYMLLANINKEIYDVFNLTGISKKIKIFDSVQNAIVFLQKK